MKNKLTILIVLLSAVAIECTIVHEWISLCLILGALYYNIMAYKAYMEG